MTRHVLTHHQIYAMHKKIGQSDLHVFECISHTSHQQTMIFKDRTMCNPVIYFFIFLFYPVIIAFHQKICTHHCFHAKMHHHICFSAKIKTELTVFVSRLLIHEEH